MIMAYPSDGEDQDRLLAAQERVHHAEVDHAGRENFAGESDALLKETVTRLERDRTVFKERHRLRREAMHHKIETQVEIARKSLDSLLASTVKTLAANLHEPASFHLRPELLLWYELATKGSEHPLVRLLHNLVDSAQCPVVLDDMSEAHYIAEVNRLDREIGERQQELGSRASRRRLANAERLRTRSEEQP